MTDTSIVKPLRWVDDEFGSITLKTSLVRYEVSNTRTEWLVYIDDSLSPDTNFCEKRNAIRYCQADYERRILSILDLTAHDAKVRAEALEEAAVYCEQFQMNTTTRGNHQAFRYRDKQGTHNGMGYAARLRALKGEG